MTISEAITLGDELYPNAVPADYKLRQLQTHDGLLYAQLQVQGWLAPGTPAPDYGMDALDAQLLVPEPYARDVYGNYLLMGLHRLYDETERYNQAWALYMGAFERYLRAVLHTVAASGEHFIY